MKKFTIKNSLLVLLVSFHRFVIADNTITVTKTITISNPQETIIHHPKLSSSEPSASSIAPSVGLPTSTYWETKDEQKMTTITNIMESTVEITTSCEPSSSITTSCETSSSITSNFEPILPPISSTTVPENEPLPTTWDKITEKVNPSSASTFAESKTSTTTVPVFSFSDLETTTKLSWEETGSEGSTLSETETKYYGNITTSFEPIKTSLETNNPISFGNKSTYVTSTSDKWKSIGEENFYSYNGTQTIIASSELEGGAENNKVGEMFGEISFGALFGFIFALLV
ncbi:uncharacterized protein SCDLUD_002587 [Saccharomycodes ludwigii]|uniref:uncharacterized protein n=1 Tax=Saccharomycodes ludwigii TaxID=36035 RepID=UPI001E8478DF|nr:hypothetical protein SCDLUD_002587 [Saccharomycodes ludwigii]KAH3901109.1 hypothetical protein SCDLUD_002587 [Saccharomycodes ludwigii]